MPHSRGDYVVVHVYDDTVDPPRMGHMVAKIAADVDYGTRYFVATEDVFIAVPIMHCETEAAGNYNLDKSQFFEMSEKQMRLLPKVDTVLEAYYFDTPHQLDYISNVGQTPNKQTDRVESVDNPSGGSTTPKNAFAQSKSSPATPKDAGREKSLNKGAGSNKYSTPPSKPSRIRTDSSPDLPPSPRPVKKKKVSDVVLISSPPPTSAAGKKKKGSDILVISSPPPTSAAAKSKKAYDAAIDSSPPPTSAAVKKKKKASDAAARKKKEDALVDWDAELDHYSEEEEPWVTKAKKKSDLVDIIPALKYAIQIQLPTLQFISLFEEPEACYYRMRPIRRLPLFPTSYRESRFYNNFRVRRLLADTNADCDAEEFIELDEPTSDHDGDGSSHDSKGTTIVNPHSAAIRAAKSNRRLPYHKQWLLSSAYGYYRCAVPHILQCLTDPETSCIYPEMFKRAYDENDEGRFATFEDWTAEVIVPMVIREWVSEDISIGSSTAPSTTQVDRIIFSRRSAQYGLLLENDVAGHSTLFRRLKAVGLGRLVSRPVDDAYESLMFKTLEQGSNLDGVAGAKLKSYKKKTKA
ncbi:hypothetical protein BJ508DRAFT_334463 [Ascobolus immersus RN42]|uniref:Uncharacterized protein n=1 Tax=Ascobolus immersus RN42 TaxID=1160509 RepID=A0A3N4HG40_ASCIM|nr:hypothetical protein BJ508DRAFT_334463 [Ascobolus immersus RN42]